MPVSLGAKPDHDFTEPLGLLSDCHRRIEHFVAVLRRVAEAAAGEVLAPERREAVETAIRYFSAAAPRHTDDEELSLFPRMRQANDPRIESALNKLDALEADHRSADALQHTVNELVARWLRDGVLPHDSTHRLIETLRSLEALYRRHIEVEDEEVFPLARDVLPAATIAEVGREMAARRGLAAGGNG